MMRLCVGTCVTVVDSHVVIAEFKPHKYATDMETTMVKNLEDALVCWLLSVTRFSVPLLQRVLLP